MSHALLVGTVAIAYVVGAIPVSHIVARLTKGIDLARTGSGTVSPWNLYREVGLWPALLAGTLDVAKGALAAALVVGRGHPWLTALAGALAVTGHNWSPFLRGAGGRGLSPATGVLMVMCWPGAAVMCAGLVVGTFARRVIRAMGVALVALIPVVVVTSGPVAAAAALVVTPVGVKTAVLIYRRRAEERRPTVS